MPDWCGILLIILSVFMAGLGLGWKAGESWGEINGNEK